MSVTIGRRSYVVPDLINRFDADLEVGAFTSIARTLTLLGNKAMHACALHPEAVSTFPLYERIQAHDFYQLDGQGHFIIGNDVWIGADVTLVKNLNIHSGAIVAARSVVTKDVPPYAVVAGNPARIVKYRFTPEQIKQLLEIRWWDWPEDVIRERAKDMRDINVFLQKYATPSPVSGQTEGDDRLGQ